MAGHAGGRAAALNGRVILVTRPAAQADALCAQLAAAGAQAVRFPALAIAPLPETAEVQRQLTQLDRYDLAIFISANAVEYCLAALAPRAWPARLPIAAVGAATAQALAARNLAPSLCPEQDFSSAGLLALPALQQLQGQRIVIVRGSGGRELLRTTLTARGAQVTYLEVYRRVRPQADPTPLLQHWQEHGIDAVFVTSNEILHNLDAMVGTLGQPLLHRATLVVASERIAEQARALGFEGILLVAQNATDAAMLAALREHFNAPQASKRIES